MQILISHNSKEPIYEQIVLQIKQGILSGEITAGYALPSMRQLAKDLDVSLITTKRSYEELEKQGLIYSVVGKGSFVVEQNKEMIIDRKQKAIEEQLLTAIRNGKEIGLDIGDLTELLMLLYEEE
ncbi:MAG: GntR family transcriptional regulator [Solibacillus sp.]|jgi:GntR family transcriptional regulator|uniref:GntR family transcriptional regulator n=1 Tax=unclassified Solibacillus TaxID=2637870 RepID=UPI0030F73F57